METVKDHYDRFLGSVYSWILGDFGNARGKNAAFFQSLGLVPANAATAVDLGCGPGCQSIPLAELGFDVLAIDFCEELLGELRQRASGLPVRAVCDDILNFRCHLTEPAELIVCMGDTLVHLPNEEAVDALIRDVSESLRPGGKFICAIRDYVNFEPADADRFVPVRASDEQIFVCFLEYGDDTVHVHDILHRKVDGEWIMQISDYRKLRLDSLRINAGLEAGGLEIARQSVDGGMITIIADKPE